ncbi:MAG: ATP-binding protein [Salinivirgaceae bacterium]
MPEPLSYKDLEQQLKALKQEKQALFDELQQSEKQFHLKENLLNQIANDTKEGIVVIQRDEIKFANQTALQILGYNFELLASLKFTDLIDFDYKGQLIQYLSELGTKNNHSESLELVMLNSNKQKIEVNLFCKKIAFPNNQTAIKIRFENIQEQKSKEKEVETLRKAVDFLDSYMSEGIVLLSVTNQEDKSLFACVIDDLNSAAAKIMGKEISQIVGHTLYDVMKPDHTILVPEPSRTSFDETFELYITNLKKYIQFHLFALAPGKIACKITDISDYYLTKQQLNKNLQRNELFTEVIGIFNSSSAYSHKYKQVIDRIVYHFKPKRIFIIRNTENQKKGKLLIQYAHLESSELPVDFAIDFEAVPSWNKMLMERKMILGFMLDYLPDDLKQYLKSLNMKETYVFPIIIDNEIFGSIVFENFNKNEWDNTEIDYLKMVSVLLSNLLSRQRYEEKLLQSKEKAEEADRLKSSFLANMSHDIRIPMTAIIGFSDLLADPDLTIGEREEFIELISKSGLDLLTLIDNIVDVAKIETGQLRINLEDVDLNALLKDLYSVHSKYTKIMEHDDLELFLDLNSKYAKLPFKTDVFRFKQVMNNLIDNAIKFTDRGSIRFGVSNVWNDTMEFYIQDSGIGIAEETQHIIFERFSKIDRSYTKEYNGTGLGLAISKSLVEMLGGEIRVVSYPGKGSTFYFTHPLSKEAEKVVEKTNSTTHQSPYNWQGKTIMIAEDVDQNYKFLEFTLQPTQVNLLWARNGKEAFDFVNDGLDVDLILMDIRMPVMNGIDATKEILKIRELPIIAQTAYSLGDEREDALQAGCSHYLTKPINSGELLKLIDSVLITKE